MEHLFQRHSWHQLWAARIENAVAEVRKLPRQAFSDPGLAGKLDQIAERHAFDVATIDGEVTAQPREFHRQGSDGWGERQIYKHKVLDVTIPFRGEHESFFVSPTRYSIPSLPAKITGDSLTVVVADDERADQEIKNFIQEIKGNLDTLRQDLSQVKGQLRTQIERAASEQRAGIDREQQLDSTRSFKVIR
jgi:hypothetical protein